MEFKATSFKNHGVINIFIFQPFVATAGQFQSCYYKTSPHFYVILKINFT